MSFVIITNKKFNYSHSFIVLLLTFAGVSLRIGGTGEYWKVTEGLLWKGKAPSGNKQNLAGEFCVHSSWRILLSPMPNEHPVFDREHTVTLSKSVEVVVFVIVRAFPLLLIWLHIVIFLSFQALLAKLVRVRMNTIFGRTRSLISVTTATRLWMSV